MTGYGLAFPLNSKHKSKFNEMLLEYRENGDLERLSRYWLHGVCKPNMQEKRASEPLSIDQFLSAFLLLILGEVLPRHDHLTAISTLAPQARCARCSCCCASTSMFATFARLWRPRLVAAGLSTTRPPRRTAASPPCATRSAPAPLTVWWSGAAPSPSPSRPSGRARTRWGTHPSSLATAGRISAQLSTAGWEMNWTRLNLSSRCWRSSSLNTASVSGIPGQKPCKCSRIFP